MQKSTWVFINHKLLDSHVSEFNAWVEKLLDLIESNSIDQLKREIEAIPGMCGRGLPMTLTECAQAYDPREALANETKFRQGFAHGYNRAMDDAESFTVKQLCDFVNGPLQAWRDFQESAPSHPPVLKPNA